MMRPTDPGTIAIEKTAVPHGFLRGGAHRTRQGLMRKLQAEGVMGKQGLKPLLWFLQEGRLVWVISAGSGT